MTGRAVVQERARFRYVETTLKRAAGMMRRILADRSLDFFCLNDGSYPEIPVEERTANVRSFLEAYFPVPAPWEVPVETAPAGAVPYGAGPVGAGPAGVAPISGGPGSASSSAAPARPGGSPARG
jgi:hypothetical protein